jgi:tetratricopeptide (TPR) repeat protein
LAILVLFSCDQLRYWRSAVDLWARTVDVTKDNFFAEQNLGAALLASDRYQEALTHFEKAGKLRRCEAGGHLNLGGDFTLVDRPRDAIVEYETAIPLVSNPDMLIPAYNTLGRLYAEIGNYEKALSSYQQALRINPDRTDAREELAKVELSDAMRNVAESPTAEGYLRLGQVLQQAERITEARVAYEQALELNPKLGDAKRALDALSQQSK